MRIVLKHLILAILLFILLVFILLKHPSRHVIVVKNDWFDFSSILAAQETPIQRAQNFSELTEKNRRMKRTIEEDLLILPAPRTNNTCELGAWNNINTEVLPMHEKYEEWKNECGFCVGNTLEDGEMRLISAFVYKDHIAVVTSLLRKDRTKEKMYCHYYDCNRELIGTFESILFPVATVRCVRRVGAEYISLTVEKDEKPVEPIPIVDRVGKPKYEIGVCGGQIYGPISKQLNLVEFIEHHRLIGASFFYLTIFNSDEETTRVIHDYERLGLLDPTWVNLEIKHVDWKFQMIQATDCYYRSRMHSKWTINIDHDERLVMKNPSSLSSLLAKLPDNIVGLSFSISRIPVAQDNLPKDATYFETYTNMGRPTWLNLKTIHQHAHSHFPFYHWFWRIDTGYRIFNFNTTVGYFRHYRYISDKYLSGNWYDGFGPYMENKIGSEFSGTLRSRIVDRMNYLFDQRYIRCETVDPEFFLEFAKRDKCVFDNGTTINI